MTSSARYKEEIKPMAEASEARFALTPVTFRYKKEIDPAGASQLGLVAEDVEKVNPNLVVRDKEGKPYTVRYDQVNPMLLNEFQRASQSRGIGSDRGNKTGHAGRFKVDGRAATSGNSSTRSNRKRTDSASPKSERPA